MPRPGRVILITSDHMRHDCIGAWGNAGIHTPNLDRLAEGGVNFRNCFAQNPVCMPSRASFMTGLYPQQTGVTGNGHTLPAGFRPTVAHLMDAAGFAPVHIGKLHLQPHEDHDLLSQTDNTYGFRLFMRAEGRGSYLDAWMRWLSLERPDLVETFRCRRPTDPRRLTEERGGRALDASWRFSHAGWVADAASRYLKSGFGSRWGEGVFLHLGFHHPHPPLNPTREAFEPYAGAELPPRRSGEAEWEDKPEPLASMLRSRRDWSEEDFVEYRRHFYALVTEMDLAIGAVTDLLEADGVLEDTLVVFTSDHGDMCGDHSMTHKGPHCFDEVMRVPLLLHWPEGLGGSRRDVEGLVELTDLVPTVVGLAGGRVPGRLPGRSYAEALLGGAECATREDVFAFGEGSAMLRTLEQKYVRWEGTGTEVAYDLTREPFESRNLAGDPEFAPDLARLRERMLSRALSASHSALERTFRF